MGIDYDPIERLNGSIESLTITAIEIKELLEKINESNNKHFDEWRKKNLK